jgi:hypothetical protein
MLGLETHRDGDGQVFAWHAPLQLVIPGFGRKHQVESTFTSLDMSSYVKHELLRALGIGVTYDRATHGHGGACFCQGGKTLTLSTPRDDSDVGADVLSVGCSAGLGT